jgi:hypothetical protein
VDDHFLLRRSFVPRSGWIASILVLVLGTPAWGQPGTFDITAYGARPGGGADAAFEAVYQAARELRSRRPALPITVRVPGAELPYYLTRPVLWDLGDTRFLGDGPGLSVLRSSGGNGPLLMPGVYRDGPDGPTHPAHRAPLGPLLDGSVGGARWAIRTGGTPGLAPNEGDREVVLPYTGLSQGGRHWRDFGQFTLSVAVRSPGGGPVVPQGAAWGHGRWRVGPGTPWLLASHVRGNVELMVQTVAADAEDPSDPAGWTARRWLIPVGAALGTVHLTVQVDVPGATVRAWVDRSEVEVEPLDEPDGWGGAGRTLAPNELGTFKLGGTTGRDLNTLGAVRDIVYCGLHVRSGLWCPVGASDAQTYFTRTAATIGLLPLTDGPDGPQGGRLVRVEGPNPAPPGTASGASSWGVLYDTAGTGSVFGRTVHGIRLEGLSFVLGGVGPLRYASGAGVAAGAANALEVRDCHFLGGQHGLAKLRTSGGLWAYRVERCRFNGQWDAGVVLRGAGGVLVDLYLFPIGNAAVRIDGGGVTIRDSFLGNGGLTDATTNEYAIVVTPGSDDTGRTLHLDGVMFDQEFRAPSIAALSIRAPGPGAHWPGWLVTLDRLEFAGVRANGTAALVRLSGGQPNRPSLLDARGLLGWKTPPRYVVAAPGSAWRVHLGPALPGQFPDPDPDPEAAP